MIKCLLVFSDRGAGENFSSMPERDMMERKAHTSLPPSRKISSHASIGIHEVMSEQGSKQTAAETNCKNSEESFMDKLIHKLLPISDDSENNTENVNSSLSGRKICSPGKCSYSLDYGNLGKQSVVSSDIASPAFRRRSQTLDSGQKHRRHSCVLPSDIRATSSSSAVDKDFTESQTRKEMKIQEVKDKYRQPASFQNGGNTLLRKVSQSGQIKANSMTLLKPDNSNQNSTGRERTVKSFGHLEQLKEKLAERGEKVGLLDSKSEAMKDASQNFSRSAQKLAQKYKHKKWYEW